ncbi:MAG TPA: TIGR00730 family Rossman fold protein [Myxococcales bacterium]|jgi:hypothetical protein|nr:TIGR00730 family Rossman fold protein [Myxococcales bacterium]
MRRICVFCGSRSGVNPALREQASLFGEVLARKGLTLVFGGGSIGLMGAIADAVLARGGEAIGVIPRGLEAREVAHASLSQLHVVGSMHERKAKMASLADAFVALPGGMGTLDELCEIVTWAQLGIHGKPCGLLNVAGYWNGFLSFLDHAVAEGFLPPEHRRIIQVDDDPERLLDSMSTFVPPQVRKWLGDV